MDQIIKLFICVLIYGCFSMSVKNDVTNDLIEFREIKAPAHVNDFIKRWHKIAQLEQEKYPLLASIKLSQSALESNWGRSSLALNANNFFGIKSWTGKGYKLPEGLFKIYETPWSSFRGNSKFLMGANYKNCRDCDNYKCWANQLQKAKYATDPNYSKKLISIIEKYELYRYDN